MNRRLVALLAGLLVFAAPSGARAGADWFASLYSLEGAELRADEGVFALFALMNAAGYSEAPVVRAHPVISREYDPVRIQLRATLVLEPELRQKLERFFDEHPQSMRRYVEWVLSTKGAPSFEPTGASPSELKGFEALLAEFYARNDLGKTFAALQDDYRAALRPWLAQIDQPLANVRKTLKQKEAAPPFLVLVANPLDGRGNAYASLQQNELFAVVGPSSKPDLYSMARAYAWGILEPSLAKRKITSAADLAAAAGADSPQSFAIESLARAVACYSLGLSDTEIAARTQGGYWAVPALVPLVRSYDRGERNFDSLINDSLVAIAISRDAPKDVGDQKGPKAN